MYIYEFLGLVCVDHGPLILGHKHAIYMKAKHVVISSTNESERMDTCLDTIVETVGLQEKSVHVH